MSRLVVLIAGPIAVGKTALAGELARDLAGEHVRVRQALASTLGLVGSDRRELQERGRTLDLATNGAWLREYLDRALDDGRPRVVDALRTVRQWAPIHRAGWETPLVFLTAAESTQRNRYAEAAATDEVKASMPFDQAIRHPTEGEVARLRSRADLVLATDDAGPAGLAAEVLAALGLASPD